MADMLCLSWRSAHLNTIQSPFTGYGSKEISSSSWQDCRGGHKSAAAKITLHKRNGNFKCKFWIF